MVESPGIREVDEEDRDLSSKLEREQILTLIRDVSVETDVKNQPYH
jgi:hypothetical protein